MTRSTDLHHDLDEVPKAGPVLIVDDEEFLTVELAEMLEGMGIACLCVSSAGEALTLIAERSDIAAVVTDLKMPDLNGLQLLRAMREKGHQHAVIIMSGHVDEGEREHALGLGALCYLAKPCDICTIPQLLHRYVFDECAGNEADCAVRLNLPRSA